MGGGVESSGVLGGRVECCGFWAVGDFMSYALDIGVGATAPKPLNPNPKSETKNPKA